MESSPQEIDINKLAISPIAEPMASEKLTLKTISLVSKLAKVKLIKRGVKEVNKFFRRSENKKQAASCYRTFDTFRLHTDNGCRLVFRY